MADERYEAEDQRLRRALQFVFEVQRQIDQIFREDSEAVEVRPLWVCDDGRLAYLVLSACDAGL
jgi:hypothetical protein